MMNSQPASPISLLIVDDHPLMLDGISAIVGAEPDINIIGRALNGEIALKLLADGATPEVVLLDLQLPDMSGIDLMERMRAVSPATRFVVLTTFGGDAQVLRAMKAGAHSYLLKSMHSGEIAEAIRVVHGGRRYIPQEIAMRLAEFVGDAELTPRELDVLRLIAQGYTNNEIGAALNVTSETAKTHVGNILSKLQVRDRTLAVTVAMRRGILMN